MLLAMSQPAKIPPSPHFFTLFILLVTILYILVQISFISKENKLNKP